MSADEHFLRAKAAYQRGELRASSIELKNALRKDPENADARRLLGTIYLKLGEGFGAEKELRTAEGLGIAREAILVLLLEALQLQGKHERILEETEKLPALDPSIRAQVLAYRAMAWIGKGETEKGRAEYDRALTLDPLSPLALLGEARLFVLDQDFDAAHKLIGEALKTAPEDARLWSFQGDLLFQQGEFKAAESSYGKAIQFRQLNHMDRAHRAMLRIFTHNYSGAKDDITRLKKQAPNFFMSHYVEGLLALHKNDFSSAQAALQKSLNLNERNIQARYFLGVSLLQQDQLAQAERALERYLSAVPTSLKAGRPDVSPDQLSTKRISERQNDSGAADEAVRGGYV